MMMKMTIIIRMMIVLLTTIATTSSMTTMLRTMISARRSLRLQPSRRLKYLPICRFSGGCLGPA